MSPIAWRIARQIKDDPYEEGEDPMVEMEHNLEVITRGILEYVTLSNVSLWYQRHTVGASVRLCQLLGRVIRVVSCYREHHVGE